MKIHVKMKSISSKVEVFTPLRSLKLSPVCSAVVIQQRVKPRATGFGLLCQMIKDSRV